MENLALATNYSTDDSKREKLYPLFEKVFGIEAVTLKDFYSRGFWNPAYRPYTFFDEERAVANVSMFSLPMTIQSTLVKAAGIQSVMTDPDYRRKGLMKLLLKEMLKDIDLEFELAFLFTDTPSLYTFFGFRQVQEHYFEHQMIIVFEVEGKTLKLYDIIGNQPSSLEKIYAQIPTPSERIELYFSPDLFNEDAFKPVIINSSSSLMVRGQFDMKKYYFKFPITAVF